MEYLRQCLAPNVVRRAVKYSVVVGIVLVVINHGDTIFRGEVGSDEAAKMALTFLVPYSVSTLSSVGAMREMEASRTTAGS
jgi:hypothetical protein